MQIRKTRSRERDPYTIRKQILESLREHGPMSYTRLSYMVELNSAYMDRHMQELKAAGLVQIIPMNEENKDTLKQYEGYVFNSVKRVVIITKKGLSALKVMDQMIIIDVKKRADLREIGFTFKN